MKGSNRLIRTRQVVGGMQNRCVLYSFCDNSGVLQGFRQDFRLTLFGFTHWRPETEDLTTFSVLTWMFRI